LATPFADIELIQPMGRGATMALKMDRLNPGAVNGSKNMGSFVMS
jgi:hypothetical protein